MKRSSNAFAVPTNSRSKVEAPPSGPKPMREKTTPKRAAAPPWKRALDRPPPRSRRSCSPGWRPGLRRDACDYRNGSSRTSRLPQRHKPRFHAPRDESTRRLNQHERPGACRQDYSRPARKPHRRPREPTRQRQDQRRADGPDGDRRLLPHYFQCRTRHNQERACWRHAGLPRQPGSIRKTEAATGTRGVGRRRDRSLDVAGQPHEENADRRLRAARPEDERR